MGAFVKYVDLYLNGKGSDVSMQVLMLGGCTATFQSGRPTSPLAVHSLHKGWMSVATLFLLATLTLIMISAKVCGRSPQA